MNPKGKSQKRKSPSRAGAAGRHAGGDNGADGQPQDGRDRCVRYAVVGLGYIAQIAMLPAFAHAKRNSTLAALVSDDPAKLKSLARKYKVPSTYSYAEYDACLRSGDIDAVYIALPNSLHAEYAVRAARAGIHVLCEKPMAVTEAECEEMNRAAKDNGVKLMIAYRLHLEAANLEAVAVVEGGKLGDPRAFNSLFSMQVREGNIRLKRDLGGGTLYDIGIYCINAARYLFQDEPTEVFCRTVSGSDARFREVDEMATVVMMFPGQRFASFTCSFGAADVSAYEVLGTKGKLRVDPAYELSEGLTHHLTIGDKTRTRTFPKRDQFAPQLVYFSNCVLTGRDPEPSGLEGLIDVHIIRSLYRSADLGRPVELARLPDEPRPQPDQRITRPPVDEPELIHASEPSR